MNHYIFATDFSEFLKRKAVTVDVVEFAKIRNEFLNNQFKKGKAKWFEGSILSSENTRFNQLKLKFNVLNNSLYVNFNQRIYRVPNYALIEFIIVQSGEKMTFRKGFGISSQGVIRAEFNGSSQELLTYLNAYPKFQTLNIGEISLSQNEMSELTISLKTVSRSQLMELKAFIDSHDNIEHSELEYDVPRIGETKYLQVLYENEFFVVLKYHFKRTTSTESVSLVKVSNASIIADEDYYLAGPDKQLVEFLFTKKSMEKSLNSLNLTYDKELQNIGSESRAVKWFKSNTFTLRSR